MATKRSEAAIVLPPPAGGQVEGDVGLPADGLPARIRTMNVQATQLDEVQGGTR